MTLIVIILFIGVAIFFIIRQQNGSFKSRQESVYLDIDHKYNEERARKQKEVDRILDKISKRGLDSLTEKEKATLEEFRKK